MGAPLRPGANGPDQRQLPGRKGTLRGGDGMNAPPIESGCGWIGVHGQKASAGLAIGRVHNG